MIIATIRAPSAWAPYLINGDASSLDDEERRRCDEFWANEGVNPASCLTCRHVGYAAFHPGFYADCEDYSFPLRIND